MRNYLGLHGAAIEAAIEDIAGAKPGTGEGLVAYILLGSQLVCCSDRVSIRAQRLVRAKVQGLFIRASIGITNKCYKTPNSRSVPFKKGIAVLTVLVEGVHGESEKLHRIIEEATLPNREKPLAQRLVLYGEGYLCGRKLVD